MSAAPLANALLELVPLGPDEPLERVREAVPRSVLRLCGDAAAAALVMAVRGDVQVVAVAGRPGRLVAVGPADAPCSEVLASGHPVHARGNLSRWPELLGTGITDVVAGPVELLHGVTACIAAYADRGTFTADAVPALATLAHHVGAVMANADALVQLRRTGTQLAEGLRSREVIGLAKGILMRQEACTEEQAFTMLAVTSQRLNRKLRDVARELVVLTEARAATRGAGA